MKRAVALAAFFAFAFAAPSASGAEFGIAPGSVAIRMLDAEGNPEDRAGSHPDRLQIDFGLDVEGTGTTARDFALDLPAGLIGSLDAVPECPRELFEKGEEECPATSRVGTMTLDLTEVKGIALPIFQVEPGPGEVAAFGTVPGVGLPLEMELRPGDYGITVKGTDLPQVPLTAGHMEMWGVPADHQSGTDIPRRPFLTAPTRCGPMTVTFHTRSWQADAPWLSASAEADAPLRGCEDLAFEPQLGFQLSNPQADSSSGARFELNMPENPDPDGLASAEAKNIEIALPSGLAFSPAGIAAITPCSDAQLGLGKASEVSCPASSQLGRIEFESPAFPEPLTGDLYIGAERPGERFRLFIVVPGSGVAIKSSGSMRVDPLTGRLTTTLSDLPQVPISRLSMSIEGGSRALLATPLTCGSFAATARFETHSGGAPVESIAAVKIGAGPGGSACPSTVPFAPRLIAETTRHRAGRATAMSMTLSRQPGEQLPKRFVVSLPKGLSTALDQIELCPDAAAASGACPAGSRIGSAFVEVGTGSSTVSLHGDMYVAGAYRGAPFSTVMAFHAAIGPFDLGTMAVRTEMQVDRRSGRVAVVADSLPDSFEGVPVRLRSIGMVIDRQGLIRNPTSCGPTGFDATMESIGGATATAKSPLTVNGCDRLGFKPRLSMALSGPRSELRRHGRPGLRIAAHLRPGDTNLRALRLSFPPALKFNPSAVGEICPRVDALDGLCTSRARVGTAYAWNSLSTEPLKGSLYVVQPEGEGLPDLWVSVATRGVHMDLKGKASLRHGHLVTDLMGLPDIPLSAFVMKLRGGKDGAVSLRTEPCNDRAQGLASRLTARGQNGAQRTLRVKATAKCGKT